jgi:transposase
LSHGRHEPICLADFEWRSIEPRHILLDRLTPHTIVLADKAYYADHVRALIEGRGATPDIPPKNNRRGKPCFSERLYRERNLIERF